MASKFGGVAVEDQQSGSKFGGVAIDESTPSVISRAIKNLPSSIANFVKNAPLAPSAGPRPVQDEKGNWVFPPISLTNELGGVISGIGNMISNPSESFAQDPVGTTAFPAMLAYGAYRGLRSAAPIVSGAVQGAKEGALKKYAKQGGIVPGAIRGAIYAYQNMPEPPGVPPSGLTGTEGIKPGPLAPVPSLNIRGTENIPAPLPGAPTPAAEAAVAAASGGPAASVYEEVAQAYMKKPYAKLSPADQASVNNIVNKLHGQGPLPAPPGTLPTPGVNPASVIPEGEHAIIRRVAEANRGNKDVTIARTLKDEGITREAFDKMPDADLRKRVTDLGFRPSTGKNYSRTWEAFKRDLRSLLD